ncbi:cytochrome P450 71A1-like [Aristolochia californica]|uniref:cytochrome P450 71A1-like n=1 Tax=Aristolochia californica TaxID=171875 RepID=UPI0035DE5B4A
MAVSVFFLTFLLLLLPAFLLFNRNRRGRSLPPGPFQLPIIGNLHQLREVNHRSLWSLSKQFGSLMFLKLGRRPLLVASSAEMAREVMKSQDLQICSRPSFVSQTMLSYNNRDVVFAPYGPHWRKMRKISILELFSVTKVQSFSSIRNQELRKMIRRITRSCSSPQEPVDLSEMLLTFTNEILLRIAFGESYLRGDEQQKVKLLDAVKEELTLLSAFFIMDYLPQLGWIDVLTGLFGRLRKNFNELDSLYENVFEEHLDKKSPTPEKEAFVDILLRLQRELNLGTDDIKGTLMDFLIGGSDTTSAALEWAMTELMRNPSAMMKAQEEVRRIVKGKQQVEETDIHKLEFLNAVIKETLRLHPPAPLLLPRETLHHCKIAGYDIPPQTTVIVNAFAIGHDQESWQNPEEFMPERFENSSIDYRGKDFELVPFGAGRRGCPGLSFGIANVELALANLLFCFDWELPEGMSREEIDMSDTYRIVMTRKTPLRLVPIIYCTGTNESES